MIHSPGRSCIGKLFQLKAEIARGVETLRKGTNCSSTTLKMIQEDAIFMADHFARKDVMTATIKLEAVYLPNGKWAVRPAGELGTFGFYPKPWTAIYVKARSAEEAIKKAEKLK